MRVLIEEGGGRIDPNARNGIALQRAIKRSSFATVNALLELSKKGYRIKVAGENNSSIQNAASASVAVFALLMEYQKFREDDAACRGYPRDCRLDIIPAAEDNAVFKIAARLGNADLVDYLLKLPVKYQIDPAAGGGKALQSAFQYQRLEVVKLLLRQKGRGIRIPMVPRSQGVRWFGFKNRNLLELNWILEMAHLFNMTSQPDEPGRHLPTDDVLRMAAFLAALEYRGNGFKENVWITAVLETAGMVPTVEKFKNFYKGQNASYAPFWMSILNRLDLSARPSVAEETLQSLEIAVPSDIIETVFSFAFPGLRV